VYTISTIVGLKIFKFKHSLENYLILREDIRQDIEIWYYPHKPLYSLYMSKNSQKVVPS